MSKIYQAITKISIITLLFCYTDTGWAQSTRYEWTATFGTPSIDQGKAIAVDAAGNTYVTGSFQGTADFDPGPDSFFLTSAGSGSIGRIDMFLVKLDSARNLIWAINMGGTNNDYGSGLCLDGKGHIYVIGRFSSQTVFGPGVDTFTSAGSTDIFFAKFDTSGNYIWAKSVGGTGIDEGYAITLDAAGEYVYITGLYRRAVDFDPGPSFGVLNASGTNSDAFIAKYDTNGNYVWAKSIGGTGNDASNSIALDVGGNICIVGTFSSTADFDPGPDTASISINGGSDAFLARYDTAGNYLWAKSIGGSGADNGYDLTTDNQGKIYVVGSFSNILNNSVDSIFINMVSKGNSDGFLIQYDTGGNCIWARSPGSVGLDIIYGVALDTYRNVYVTGNFAQNIIFTPEDSLIVSRRLYRDVFVAKFNPDGHYLWAESFSGQDNKYAQGITVDSKGNVYTTGYFDGTVDFDPGPGIDTFTSRGNNDIFIHKISQGCETFAFYEVNTCDSLVWNSKTYSLSGKYVDTLRNTADCDSVVTLYLNIKGASTVNAVVTGHYCDSIRFNGITYDSSGTYVQHYVNHIGCDSNIIYDLTIGHSNELYAQTVMACDSFLLGDSVLYTSIGGHIITYLNQSGCDSPVVWSIMVNGSPEALIQHNEETLTANSADAYQWLHCDSNIIVSGATGQSYVPVISGHYAAIVTVNGCSDTSGCMAVEVAGNSLAEPGRDNRVWVYPNPAGNALNIKTDQDLQQARIRLVNISGQIIKEWNGLQGSFFLLDISRYAPGIYWLAITEGSKDTFRLKVVKQ